MAGDCHDLAITRAKLCEPRRSGLAQTMRRTMRQLGLIAPLAEAVAKAVHGKCLAELQLELIGDEQSLLTAFLKLSDPQEQNPARSVIDSRLSQLQSILDGRGLKPEKAAKVRTNAKAADVESEYDTLYRFYSKYVHGSAWLILSSDERRENDEYRKIFAIMAQIYAGDTFAKIADAVTTVAAQPG
jgi:hypothetical protein